MRIFPANSATAPDPSAPFASIPMEMPGLPETHRPGSIAEPEVYSFDDIPSTYDVKEDSNSNISFTRPDTRSNRHGGLEDSESVPVDSANAKILSAAHAVGAERNRLVRRNQSGKAWRFDPKTRDVTEFHTQPGATPSTVSTRTIKDARYASYNVDLLGRFDPKSARTIEYRSHTLKTPFAIFPRCARADSYGSPSNDKVALHADRRRR